MNAVPQVQIQLDAPAFSNEDASSQDIREIDALDLMIVGGGGCIDNLS